MKRTGPASISGKTIVQKVRAAMQRMSAQGHAAFLKEVGSQLSATDHSIDPTQMPAQIDRDDFGEYLSAARTLPIVAGALTGAPGMGPLLQAIEEAEAEYQPGGPPVSPVHDSLFTAWSQVDLAVGRYRETLAQIAMGLAPQLGIDAARCAAIGVLAAARLGVYRVSSVAKPLAGSSQRYRARELVTGIELSFQCLDTYDIRESDLLLIRPTALPEASARQRGVSHLAFATPYVLEGRTDPEWTDYFERAAGELKLRLDADSYARVMRGEGDPRRWLEYVVVGYVGQRAKNMVRVVGLPDLPHTLPHHRDYSEEAELVVLPRASAGERATLLARRLANRLVALLEGQPRGYLVALGRRFTALQELGGQPEEWQPMVLSTAYYQVGPNAEPPLIETLIAAKNLDEEELEYVDALRRGIASVFEVTEVNRGVGMKMHDLVGGGEYDVSERAATMQLPNRALLCGRLVEYRGVWLIDAVHGRSLPPECRDRLLRRILDRSPRDGRKVDRGDTQVYEMLCAWQAECSASAQRAASRPEPVLLTPAGEPAAMCRAVFEFDAHLRPRVRDAITRLRGCQDGLDSGHPGVEHFAILAKDNHLEAGIELTHDALVIVSNGAASLDRVVKRLKPKLGCAVVERSREVLDPARLAADAVPRPTVPPTAEMAAALAQGLRTVYEGFLDTPIPALNHKSPREASRDPAAHAQLDALLRQHEYALSQQVGGQVVDFAALRRELGLSP